MTPPEPDSLSSPRNPAQTSRSTSLAQGSVRSSVAVAHKLNYRLKPAATVKRYERSVKLEPPYIDVNLPPFTTTFADG